MKIIKIILDRPIGTIMLWMSIVTGGIWAAAMMRTDFIPDLAVPELTVLTSCSGFPAEDVRRLITIPLEEALSSVRGVKQIESLSRDGLSLIRLEFPWGSNRTTAGIRAREAAALAWQELPSKASKPQILAIDPGDIPVMTLAVIPKGCSLAVCREISEKDLASRLQRIEGVGSVQISGGKIEEIEVNVDLDEAASAGLTFSDISAAVNNLNIASPAGIITENNIDYSIKTFREAESISDLYELYLFRKNSADSNRIIRLRDIADINIGSKKQKSVFFYAGNNSSGSEKIRECVRIQIRRRSGTSPSLTSINIRNELEEMNKSFKNDVAVKIIEDRSFTLKRSLYELIFSLVSGSFFAFAVVFLFLKSIKKALVVVTMLPASLSAAILMLYLCDRSLNLMSIGGLAVGVGMVIDNAIVVIESLSVNQNNRSPVEILTELSAPLAGSTLTSVIVYLPLLLLGGLPGALFSDLGISVIFALSASFAASFSLVPVLFLNFAGRYTSEVKNCGRGLSAVKKIIKFSFRKPLITAVATLAIVLSGILPLYHLDFKVIGPVKEDFITCSLQLPPGSSINIIKETAVQLINQISKLEDVESAAVWAGGEPSDTFYLASADSSTEIINFRIRHRRGVNADLLRDEIKEILTIPGTESFIEPSENVFENLIGINSSNEWVVKGDNPETARSAAELISAGIKDSVLRPGSDKAQIRIVPEKQKMISTGIDLTHLSDSISASIGGDAAGQFRTDNREIDIRVRSKYGTEIKKENLLQISILNEDSEPVRLESIIRIEEHISMPYLARENRKDAITIKLPGRPDTENMRLLKKYGAEHQAADEISKQTFDILKAILLSFVLLYICLGIQFESLSVPLLLLICLPPGFTGIITATSLFRGIFDLNSALGAMVIMGIAVNNGILLYGESQKHLRAPGCTAAGALYRSLSSRLKPILMTNLTTLAALLPAAVDPFGRSSQASLAVSVIGGLSISCLVSITLLPVVLKKSLEKRHKKIFE